MPINFPQKQEVQLSHPPLEEVVCQVRFPTILRISREEPADLQEKIRHRFPHLPPEPGVQIQFSDPANPNIPSVEFRPRLYRFQSQDGKIFVSLTTDFYALSVQRYAHWRDFAADLQLAHLAVLDTYRPPYATRIGLRYVNRLTLPNTRSQDGAELLSLLRPELTAMVRGEVWQDAEQMVCMLTFTEEVAQLNLRIVAEQLEKSPSILLDFDYFETGNLPMEGLVERCEQYHNVIYGAFRWCLKDESLERFQPIPAEGGVT